MPNRILREGILTSERVNSLGWPAEVFYRRLISVVDDFGRYWAKPELLRAGCYPLHLDRVGNSDIGKWTRMLEEAALVRTYTVAGKEYLELLDFRQQVRAKESKFPAPDEQMRSACVASAHLDGDVVGDEDERKPVSGSPPDPSANSPGEKLNGHRRTARELLDFLNEKTGRRYEPVDANLAPLVARLKEGTTPDDVRSVIAKKCRDWSTDERMEQYLRPKTLFNATNFANYKGELKS